MGNIFANKKGVKGESVEEDYIGGGGILDTDIYEAEIKYAYIGKSNSSSARSLVLSLKVGDLEKQSTIWMTNGQGDVTYKDKNTGEEKNLPGFNQVNSLCMLIAGQEVGDMEVEEKILKLYDFESKKEISQTVECFIELHGQKLQVAIQKQIIDKTEKNDNTGDYEPTGETREINEFIKFFPETHQVTISEVAHYVKSLGGDFDDVLSDGEINKAIAQMPEQGDYATKWLERNRGEVYDKSTKKKEGKAFKGGNKKSEGGSKDKKKSSLFDD